MRHFGAVALLAVGLFACAGAAGEDGARGIAGPPGGDGLPSLLVLEPEPAGENCASGGTVARSGVDADGDGALGRDEATETAYVCNGEDAPDAGEAVVVDGGGLDAGSGVATENPLCPGGVVDGDVTIENSLDVAMLDGCVEISGGLIVNESGVVSLSLQSVASLGALLVRNNGPLEGVDMPALRSVETEVRVADNGALRVLRLPALVTVGGLLVERNPSLPTCAAEALRDQVVAGGFTGTAFVSGNDDDGICPAE